MIGENFHDGMFGNDFLDTMSIAQATKLHRDKLDYTNIKTFYISKDIISILNRPPEPSNDLNICYPGSEAQAQPVQLWTQQSTVLSEPQLSQL